jgi:hypothetical protein
VALRAIVNLLVVTAVAGLGGLVLAGAASPAGSVPSCAASVAFGANPQADCLVRPWAVSGAAHVTGSAKLTKLVRGKKVPGGYTYRFTVVVNYANPDPVCVDSAPVPCQQQPPVIRYVGNYVKGAPSLGAAGVGDLNLTPCPAAGPKCTLHYQVISSEVNGHVELVYSLNVVDLTTNPSNDLGEAGFEFPIVLDVPKPSAKS